MTAATHYERRRVYDPLLRFMHAWNALAIVTLLATGWGSELFEHGALESTVWTVHIYAGYGLILGLVARVTWGLVGPRHARFGDLWHWQTWKQALTRLQLPDRNRWGHDPVASAVYLAVYAALGVMAVSGLVLAAGEHTMGPLAGTLLDSVGLSELMEEPHEFLANAIAAFIGVHLAALWIHQRFGGIPVAQSMWSGEQLRPAAKEGSRA
ncbi:MAG: cytochrome b/b6 domain-containing protein [Pseudomonadota bacterium]